MFAKLKKDVEQKAIDIVMAYEEKQGRNPHIVSGKGCGYDIESDGRYIEVKGSSESWDTYNWLCLYPTEVDCLRKFSNNFYLYIVKMDRKNLSENFNLYVIPGKSLLEKFNIKVTAYSLSPISQRKLKEYKT